MTVTTDHILDLDTLRKGLPGITPEIGALFAQATRICLYRHGHSVGVSLSISGQFPTACSISWSEVVTPQTLNAWQDQQEATEFGACGVAILLMLELTEYTVIRRAIKGDGVDYWLGNRDTYPPFQDSARLEISGILTGDDTAIQRRLREKQQQTAPTDGSLPVHIVIVEFSKPTSHYLVKS